MLGSIYIGISGMNAFSNGLQTISNNVTNLNTDGFKTTTVSFKDVYSYGGSGLSFSSNSGGQHGDGVVNGSSTIDFSQGTLRQTGNALDLAIQGSGFLVLSKDGDTVYTRTGSFAVDTTGYIVEQGTNNRLCILNSAGQAVPVNIGSLRSSAPTATTKVTFANNLSTDGKTATVSTINVYDSNGGKHVWQAVLTKATDGTNSWNVVVTDDKGITIGTQVLKFAGSSVDPTTSTLTFTATPSGANVLSVVFDFSGSVTSFTAGSSSTLSVASSDGNAVGALTTVTVDTNGVLQLAYSNSKTVAAGSIAVADFRDPQQLNPLTGGLFQHVKPGEMRLLASGTDGVGTVQSQQIEASNVNLSSEFGELIIIQRGYQGASQVVSVSNDMIQELFGIRGRG